MFVFCYIWTMHTIYSQLYLSALLQINYQHYINYTSTFYARGQAGNPY